jgi:hypothetical protein
VRVRPAYSKERVSISSNPSERHIAFDASFVTDG